MTARTLAIVVADSADYLNWLQKVAGNGIEFVLLKPSSAEDMLARVERAGKIDLAFFQFDPGTIAARATWVEKLLERFPNLPVVGLGAEGQPDVVLAAMRAGARDFFVLRRDDANVAALMGRLLRRGGVASRGDNRTGKLFAVLTAHPDESAAFLAEHLALACAEQLGSGQRVLLADIATPAGASAIFLNINQSYGVLDAISDALRCDQTLVDTAFARHSSGLYVLSLPEDLMGRPMFDVNNLLQLTQVFRSLFACTVLAIDGHLPVPALAGIIEQADRTLLVSDQSVMKSRHDKHLLRALRQENSQLNRIGLVVDNYRKRLGLEAEDLAELLDLPLLAKLSTQVVHRIQAMNTGEPLYTIAPRDPYAREARRLAGSLLTGQQLLAEEPGLFEKLFG